MDQQENLNTATTNENETHEPETMQEVLDQYEASTEIRKGETRIGTVIGENENGLLIDVGFKCEGIIPEREWTHRPLIDTGEKPKPGEQIQVEVVSVRNGEEAQLILNRWHHELDKRWAELEKKLSEANNKVTVKGIRVQEKDINIPNKGTERIKCGLTVEYAGIEGFIPVSHLTLTGRGVNPSNFIGRELEVKVLDKDRRKHRLVFSRRELLEQIENEKKEQFYSQVHEGDIKEGEINSITDFGIFVTLGTMDGLVHVTEITWKRNFKMRELFKKGDKVTVKVIGIDREHDRISLSIKQVTGDPWDNVTERIHQGDTVKGVVTNMTDFGAFVEIEPGIEGLIHVGDISWTRIRRPRDVLKRGQEVEALVLEIEPEKKRISLGCKQLNDPWKDIEQRYQAGQDIPVKVVRLADFGAFVQVEEGVEALIHISQLSRKHVGKPGEILSEGQEVTARILEVDPSQRRMRLSLSALEPEPEPAPEVENIEREEVAENKPQRRENRQRDRGERSNKPEKSERRERPNKKPRAKPVRENTSYTDDDAEGIAYNPFAEAFKDANWSAEE